MHEIFPLSSLPPSARFLCRGSLTDPSAIVFMGSERLYEISGDTGNLAAPVPAKVQAKGGDLNWATVAHGRVALHDDTETLSVYELATGTLLFRLPNTAGAFSAGRPDLMILAVEEAAGYSIQLREILRPGVPVGQVLNLSEELDDPRGLRLTGSPDGSGRLVIACYGYCFVSPCNWGSRGLELVGHARTLSEGLVHDQIDICDATGGVVLVNHGYGCGIAALRVREATVSHCPTPGSLERNYGAFGTAVLAPDGAAALVATSSGLLLWKLDGLAEEISLAEKVDAVLGAVGRGWLIRTTVGYCLLHPTTGEVERV